MKFKFLLALAIIATALFSFACPKKKGGDAVTEMAKAPTGAVLLSRDVRQTTPKGAVHYGKSALSTAQLGQIDDGLDQLFAAAREDGFKENATRPYSFFEIFTPPYPCVPAPVSGTPGFLVGGGPAYDGTEFDQYNPRGAGVKDGRSVIYAAEMVLSVGTPGSIPPVGQMFVCPDAVVLTSGVKHGGEHIFLANTPYTEEFHATGRDWYAYADCSIYHNAGILHPLLPRNGRCATDKPTGESAFTGWEKSEETAVPDEVKQFAGDSVEISDNDRLAKGAVIHAVK